MHTTEYVATNWTLLADDRYPDLRGPSLLPPDLIYLALTGSGYGLRGKSRLYWLPDSRPEATVASTASTYLPVAF